MTTAEIDRTIADLINEALERIEDPDPNAVARIVLHELDPDDATPPAVQHFAVRGIAERVRDTMSRQRRGGGVTQSARWAEASRQNASGDLDIARFMVYTGAEHKWLPDCGAEDLVGAAHEQEQQASALQAGAGKLRALAAMVERKRGASTVADLDPKKVRGVLNA